jgi:hypothetical protein
MLGLFLGPGYYIVSAYLSGEPGETFILTERAARWALPDGTILRFARGEAFRPVAIGLDPNMNRIGLELTFEFAPAGEGSASDVSDEYEATLLQADQPILRRTLLVKAKSGGKRKIDIGSLEVYYPGSYVFLLEGPTTPHAPVAQVALALRHKIETVFMPFVVAGAVLLVVGLALSLEPYLRGNRTR